MHSFEMVCRDVHLRQNTVQNNSSHQLNLSGFIVVVVALVVLMIIVATVLVFRWPSSSSLLLLYHGGVHGVWWCAVYDVRYHHRYRS